MPNSTKTTNPEKNYMLVQLKLPIDVVVKLRELSSKDERSVTSYLRLLIRGHVNSLTPPERRVLTPNTTVVTPHTNVVTPHTNVLVPVVPVDDDECPELYKFDGKTATSYDLPSRIPVGKLAKCPTGFKPCPVSGDWVRIGSGDDAEAPL